MSKNKHILALAAAAALVAGCAGSGSTAGTPSSAELDALTQQIIKADFHDKGIVKVAEAFRDDETIRVCNAADVAGKPLDNATAKRIEELNMKTIQWPSDGKFLGDWKEGEKIAQSGRGFTWTDDPGLPVGGNCYNCHQISPKETSFGTIGPTLYKFGKLRGSSADIQKYVYSKIYNAKAYNLCSEMPRFGHVGALGEKQIKDLVALLLDPESPVNK